MGKSFHDSIFLIESKKENNNEFGTGFIIYQEDQFDYLLTCAHVVDAVGGSEHIKVDGNTAIVIAIGTADSLDLALLRVHQLTEKSGTLPLAIVGQKGGSIKTIGYHGYGQHHRLLKPVHGVLGEHGILKKPQTLGGEIDVWELKMDNEDYLQHGYSGAPVIDKNSKMILGVVSHRKGRGEKGLAISVVALKELLPSGKLLDGVFIRASQEGKEMEVPPKTNKFANIRLQKKIKTLQNAWEDLESKKDAILKDRSAEDRQLNIDRMSREIEKIEKQQADIEEQLIELEAKL